MWLASQQGSFMLLGPNESRQLASKLCEAGALYLEAPVLGSQPGGGRTVPMTATLGFASAACAVTWGSHGVAPRRSHLPASPVWKLLC